MVTSAQNVPTVLGGCRVTSAGFPGAPVITQAFGIVADSGATQPAAGQFVLPLGSPLPAGSRTHVLVTIESGVFNSQGAFPVVPNPVIAAITASPNVLTVQPAAVAGFASGVFNVLILSY